MTHQVYRFYDRGGRLIYVGQAACAISRARGHRSEAPWFHRVEFWTIEDCETKADALVREQTAIVTEHPMFNIDGRPEHEKPRARAALEAERERKPKGSGQPIPIPTRHALNDGSAEATLQKIMFQRNAIAIEFKILTERRSEVVELLQRMRYLVDGMDANASSVALIPSYAASFGGDAA